jgi:hypothetical protein
MDRVHHQALRWAWPAWCLTLAVCVFMSIAAVRGVRLWVSERARIVPLLLQPPPTQKGASADADPALQLRPLPRAASVVGAIEAAAGRLGVQLQRVQVVERAPTPAQLARLELQLVLHGGYGPIKALVGEVMARHGNATVSRLLLQPAAGVAGPVVSALAPLPQPQPGLLLQAQLEWVLWGPPGADGRANAVAPTPR